MGVVDRDELSDVRTAFSEMYTATLPTVYGFVSLRVGGNKPLAEDLTSETFAAALEKFRTGAGNEVTVSWLRMVAKRRLIDHWRRQGVASEKVVVLAANTRAHEDPSVEDRARVMSVLGELSEQHRAVLVMQHIEGYSVADIAEILGRSEKATESLLTRARTAFRDAYREGDDG